MKTKIISGILILFVSFTSYSQSYLIQYESKVLFNKKQYAAMPAEIRKEVKESLNARVRVYSLEYSKGKSMFKVLYSTYNGKKESDDKWIEGSKRVTFYKNFIKGFFVNIIDNDIAVKENIEDVFNWQIDNSRDSIVQGFACVRAMTIFDNDTIVAWFAPSIPIMDGPFMYSGLPGLIMQIETPVGLTKVSDIQINEKNLSEIIIPKKDKYITYKEMKESSTLTIKAKNKRR